MAGACQFARDRLKTMRRIWLMAAAAAAVSMSATAWADGARYLDDLPDVPLAPGLVEVTAEGVAFDKPEGHIVAAVAEGQGTPAMVTDFYQRALPPLGWSRQGSGPGLKFTREGETLTITVAATADGSRVRFELEP